MPKISVIVPVYKAEKYLHRCIDSILNQTFKDFEVLLIDDGSPDRSGEICDEYAKIDSRVRVFHKQNGGVSSARQCGLNNTKGEYVIHADPDDWVEPDILESMYSKALEDNADMVICDYYITKRNKETLVYQNIDKTNHLELLRQFLLGKYHGACWNKLVKANLFAKYNIEFNKDIIRWEDLFVVSSLLLNPIKVSYLAKPLYHYDIITNNNSIVRKTTKKGVESQILFCNHFISILDNTCYSDEIYSCISQTKELMFASKQYLDNEITEYCKEYNQRYIIEHNTLNIKYPIPYCLSQLLSGHAKRGHRIYNFYLKFLIPAIKIVKR